MVSPDQDRGYLDTWLTGVVAICAATLLFSGVLLTGIGAAAHATDASSAPPTQTWTETEPSTTSPDGAKDTSSSDDSPDLSHSSEVVRPAEPPVTRQPGRPQPTRTQNQHQRGTDPPVDGATGDDRGPDPGSSPQFALPVTVPTSPDDPGDAGLAADDAADADAADAQNDVGSLESPSRQALGEQLFVAGLVGLLFSIGGLATIALRRRAW